jgi:glycosyltransferase involved in cell wall biosynthesis
VGEPPSIGSSITPRPTVGAAIPVYDGAAYLGDALRSVLGQSVPVADVVVVDDGSSDASAAVAAAFGPPVRVIRRPHLGVGPARSRAVEAVGGDVIVLLDADDLLTETSVASRLRVLEQRPEVDLVFGHVRSFAEVGPDGPLALDESRPAHVAGSMLVRRLAYERVGGFRDGLRAEGLDWLLRAHELDLVHATVAEQVLWRRVHGANSSLGERSPLQEFPRLLKESLDRRRAAGPGQPSRRDRLADDRQPQHR